VTRDLTTERQKSDVYSVALSRDGKSAVTTCDDDNTLRVWDVEHAREVRRLRGHTGYVNSAVFSSDGTRVVSASSDRTLNIWDVESGQVIRTLTGHESEVLQVALADTASGFTTGAGNTSGRQKPAQNEKADVAEHPEVFDHIGLLANEPLGTAGLLSI
jgi:WD40 repeat protein